jgi:hypothetical protein
MTTEEVSVEIGRVKEEFLYLTAPAQGQFLRLQNVLYAATSL